jgi:hypothetical protein
MMVILLLDGALAVTGDSGAWPGYCTIILSLLSMLVTIKPISAACGGGGVRAR